MKSGQTKEEDKAWISRLPGCHRRLLWPRRPTREQSIGGIILQEGDEPVALERGFNQSSDIRLDTEVSEEIARFLKQHSAKSVVAVDRIIGCPHEEETDYPALRKRIKAPSLNHSRALHGMIAIHQFDAQPFRLGIDH